MCQEATMPPYCSTG